MGQLPAVCLPDPRTRQWRQLIAYRQKLVGQRVRVQNRVRALLVSRGLPQPPGHRAWTEEGLALLGEEKKEIALLYEVVKSIKVIGKGKVVGLSAQVTADTLQDLFGKGG